MIANSGHSGLGLGYMFLIRLPYRSVVILSLQPVSVLVPREEVFYKVRLERQLSVWVAHVHRDTKPAQAVQHVYLHAHCRIGCAKVLFQVSQCDTSYLWNGQRLRFTLVDAVAPF
mgnify:CR=1 FL=1